MAAMLRPSAKVKVLPEVSSPLAGGDAAPPREFGNLGASVPGNQSAADDHQFQGWKVTLLVTDSPGARGAPDVGRMLRRAGARVMPLAESAALRWVSVSDLEVACDSPLLVEDAGGSVGVEPLSDLILIAPASADFMDRIAFRIRHSALSGSVIDFLDRWDRGGRSVVFSAPAPAWLNDPWLGPRVDRLRAVGSAVVPAVRQLDGVAVPNVRELRAACASARRVRLR